MIKSVEEPQISENKRLSTILTPMLKFLFPVLGISSFVFLTIFWFVQRDPHRYSVLLALCIGGGVLYFTVMPIKKVFLEKDKLVISNYFRTTKVDINNIHSVSENTFFAPKIIRIVFKQKTIFGRSITFVPKDTLKDFFSLLGIHSVVKYLESLKKEYNF